VSAFLSDRGIGARAVWRPLHLQPPLKDAAVLGGAVAESLFQRGLSLPCSTDLTESDQDRVIEAVRAAVNP
jgi:dTDP-4-amino-4,6-dideoxygalactose transaminase